MKAFSNWVIMRSEEQTTESGIISDEGNSAIVVSVGDECPDSIKESVGEKVFYRQSPALFELNEYIVVDYHDVIYLVVKE
jgi:hypothetical protein